VSPLFTGRIDPLGKGRFFTYLIHDEEIGKFLKKRVDKQNHDVIGLHRYGMSQKPERR
jgi:hypothetical protein